MLADARLQAIRGDPGALALLRFARVGRRGPAAPEFGFGARSGPGRGLQFTEAAAKGIRPDLGLQGLCFPRLQLPGVGDGRALGRLQPAAVLLLEPQAERLVLGLKLRTPIGEILLEVSALRFPLLLEGLLGLGPHLDLPVRAARQVCVGFLQGAEALERPAQGHAQGVGIVDAVELRRIDGRAFLGIAHCLYKRKPPRQGPAARPPLCRITGGC